MKNNATLAKTVIGYPVRCVLVNGNTAMDVYRGDLLIADVLEVGGEPVLVMDVRGCHVRALTFNDLKIIMDNWNNMVEIRKKGLTG